MFDFSFKRYIQINEEIKLNFCYMIYLDKDYFDSVGEVQYDLSQHIDQDDLEFSSPEELHTTVRHVKLKYGQTPDNFIEWIKNQQLPDIIAYPKKLSVFDGNALVMELDSPMLYEWYNKVNSWITNVGNYQESDYKIYKPHMTIINNYKYEHPPKFDIQKHRIKLKFNIHKVTNQNYDVLFEKKSDLVIPDLGVGLFNVWQNNI